MNRQRPAQPTTAPRSRRTPTAALAGVLTSALTGTLVLAAGSTPATAAADWRTGCIAGCHADRGHTGQSHVPGWRTDRTERPAAPDVRRPTVHDLRYGTHPGFDRMVVDLRGSRPGYVIDHTRRLHREGSGHLVRLPGRHKMFLTLTPAYGHDRRGRVLYDGPRRRLPGFPSLRGIAFLGDFEGSVTFGFGLDRRTPYRAFVLRHPLRLVVDFRH